ncbi:hypothetical protein [Halobaculum sp. EA56]|uniref:hypothetical protein n=1 Tax=Halobaculum sp. EA56 TaxID=3421648 RepID=UPI003EBD7357
MSNSDAGRSGGRSPAAGSGGRDLRTRVDPGGSRARETDDRPPSATPAGWSVPLVVAVAVAAAIAAQSVAVGVDAAVGALDPSTLRALRLAGALDGAVAASDQAARASVATAGAGAAYALARALTWLYYRTA